MLSLFFEEREESRKRIFPLLIQGGDSGVVEFAKRHASRPLPYSFSSESRIHPSQFTLGTRLNTPDARHCLMHNQWIPGVNDVSRSGDDSIEFLRHIHFDVPCPGD